MTRRRLRALGRALLLAGAAALAVAYFATPAFARVGGGESFGGGSRSSGGGGGGGGGDAGFACDIILFLLQLCIEHPAVGVPLTAIIVVGFLAISAAQAQTAGKLSSRSFGGGGRPAYGRSQASEYRAPRTAAFSATSGPDRLRELDAGFSEPLFLDFVVLLYERAMEASGKGALGALRPYLSDAALARLERRSGVLEISQVCVGSASIQGLKAKGACEISVTIEASFQERRQNASVAQYSRERWTFSRRAGVVSKPPDTILALGCPSCGNAGEVRTDGTCPRCDQVVTDGRFHWTVSAIQVAERRAPRQDEVLDGGGEEPGVRAPTVVDTRYEAERRAFEARYPGFSWPAFEATVRNAFHALQEAWTRRDAEAARPYETDALFQAHRFWIDRFKRSSVTNVLQGVSIERIAKVKIARDAWFESITVRIFASMVDFKRRDDGTVISGDPTRPRAFSEYWTFVRRSGFDAARDATDPGKNCPSCGAPVKVSRAGICAYCETKVTSGSFGWVLSRIDQDEVYQG